jgi:hypothetical protein
MDPDEAPTARHIDVSNLEIGAVIPGGNAPITSLDFHRNGEHLVAAGRDGKSSLLQHRYTW